MSSKIIKTNLEIKQWFDFVPDKAINLWVSDPPYPFENQNGGGRFQYVDNNDAMYPRLNWTDMEDLFDAFKTKSALGARAYIFANKDGLFNSKELLEKTGWTFKNLLIWDKQKMGMGYHWRHEAEYILYVTNGKTDKFVTKKTNIFRYKKPGPKDSIPALNYYPNGASTKPHQIWRDIMQQHLYEGEIAADPFAGSDPMSVAIQTDSEIESRLQAAYVNTF